MRRKKRKAIKGLILSIALILIVVYISYYLYTTYQNIEIIKEYDAKKMKISTDYEQTVEIAKENSDKTTDIIEKVSKSVCGISKLSDRGTAILSTATETELGLGTGLIVSNNGYILSNAHVTGEKYSTCYVTIEENNMYRGTVVWADSDLDLSIIKIKADNLSVAKLGESDIIKVGQTVYAIGNPIGYEFRQTVTSGIISALNRTIKIEEEDKTSYMSDLIQTDATINPGNSGGPLISVNGEVIGINSVKITSADGIGFAIPINVVKPVINSFCEKGRFDEVTLGIYAYDEAIAQYLKLNNQFSSGIYVAKIIQNGPAENSGLKIGDVINKIDGQTIYTMNSLKEYMYSKNPGDEIKIEFTRNKNKKEVSVILQKNNI